MKGTHNLKMYGREKVALPFMELMFNNQNNDEIIVAG
jgi:hypothetical protein